jgi:hypothetical protein
MKALVQFVDPFAQEARDRGTKDTGKFGLQEMAQ